jgi:translation elongation factor EF-Tu-like GTPase
MRPQHDEQVERGVLNKGDDVEIIGYGKKLTTTITGIEMFHQELVCFLVYSCSPLD